jgi:hypothetical protein
MLPLGLLLLACSRSGGDAAPAREHAPSGTASGLLGSTPSSEAPLGSAGPVLTPEDVEAETEHRITEQNLESELDRLEREIQGE